MSQPAAVPGWFFCVCFSHTLEVGPHGPHGKAFFEEAFYGKSLRNVSAKIEEGRRRESVEETLARHEQRAGCSLRSSRVS